MCFKLTLPVLLSQLQAMGVPRNTSPHYVHVYFVDSSRNYSDVFQLMLSVVLNQLQAMGVPRNTSSHYVHVYFVDSSRNYSDVFQSS